MRGGGVSLRGKEIASEAHYVSFVDKSQLRCVNGKVVRSRGRGDGSKARMYLGGIKPIGFGVSWDPTDGEPMLGVSISIVFCTKCIFGLYYTNVIFLGYCFLFCRTQWVFLSLHGH